MRQVNSLFADLLAMSKKKKFILAIAVLLLVAFAFWMKGCLDVDKCLDNGGRWNYEKGVCEHQETGQEQRGK